MTSRLFNRRAVAETIVADDPHLTRLAHTSATFAHGLDRIVQVACLAVACLAEEAERADAEHAERIAAMERSELLWLSDWLVPPDRPEADR